MTRRGRLGLTWRWLLPVFVGLMGCSKDGDEFADWDPGDDEEVSCDDVSACDIREPDCQRLAIAVAGCLRGDDPTGLDVDIIVIDYETLLAEQTEGTEPGAVPMNERTFRSALATLNLSVAEVTTEGDIADSLDAIAAYYWQDVVVIIDRGEPLDDESAFEVLTHEIVHALQDDAGDFASEGRATNFDVWLARRSIVEGEATILGIRGGLAAAGRDPDDYDFERLFVEFQTRMSERTVMTEDPWLDAIIAFPYAWGGAYVLASELGGGRDAVRALYASGEPQSTRQVLLGELTANFGGQPWRESLGMDAVPLLGDAETALQATSSLGSWLVQALEMRKDLGLDFSVAARLRGDSLSAFSFEDMTGEPASLLVWRLRLSSEAEAAQLAAVRTLGPNVLLDRDGSDVWISARSTGMTLAGEVQAWAKQEGNDFFFGDATFDDFSCALGLHATGRPVLHARVTK